MKLILKNYKRGDLSDARCIENVQQFEKIWLEYDIFRFFLGMLIKNFTNRPQFYMSVFKIKAYHIPPSHVDCFLETTLA